MYGLGIRLHISTNMCMCCQEQNFGRQFVKSGMHLCNYVMCITDGLQIDQLFKVMYLQYVDYAK